MKTKKLLVLALAIALIVSSIGFAGAEGNLSAAGEYPIWTGSEPATITVDGEKAQNWIKNGAQPTDTVRGLLKNAGVL